MVSENRGSENADVEDNLQEKITALTICAGTCQHVVERGARAVVRIGRGIDISETWTEWFQTEARAAAMSQGLCCFGPNIFKRIIVEFDN